MTAQAFALHVACGLGLFALSALLTRLMIHLNIADIPNHRSSHAHPTPKSGGLAIAAAFFIGIVALFLLSKEVRLPTPAFVSYLVIAGALLVLGFLDDLLELRASLKLLGQLACAVGFVAMVSSVDAVALPGLGVVSLGAWGAAGTVLWIVAVMNFVNFMDGINGLVSGVSLIAAAALGTLAATCDAPMVYFSCIVLAAAILGFFVFNFPGGRIFLGDTGSQFLGFVLASLAVIGNREEGGHLSLLVVPCLLFPLLFDALLTLFLRWRRGVRLAEAHREHLYQILTRAGLSHVQVSGIYFMLTLICVAAAIGAQRLPAADGLFAPVALVPIFACFAAWVHRYGARHGVVLLPGSAPLQTPELSRQPREDGDPG